MPAMRAQASAIYIGVITIVASLGPIIVSAPVFGGVQGYREIVCMVMCQGFTKVQVHMNALNPLLHTYVTAETWWVFLHCRAWVSVRALNPTNQIVLFSMDIVSSKKKTPSLCKCHDAALTHKLPLVL